MASHVPDIRLADFRYDLPVSRIAQRPLHQRDHSKLLQYRQGQISHHHFFDLPGLLPGKSMLLLNDTRVIRARLYLRRDTGALIEILLMHPHQPVEVHSMMQASKPVIWECIIGNKKKWKPDEQLRRELEVDEQPLSLLINWHDRERNLVRMSWDRDIPFAAWLQTAGQLPLPPYIHRDADEADMLTYQTVYAEQEGAVAAPTAGLHFTDDVFAALAQQGIQTLRATLHVSAGTFLPVKTDNPADHDMHQEQMVITRTTAETLLQQIEAGDPLVAVGTTSMRWAESLYWLGVNIGEGIIPEAGQPFHIAKLAPYQDRTCPDPATAIGHVLRWLRENNLESCLAETAIMIMPGYAFRLCDGLITNFHMPETTLLLLVGAFVGDDWRRMYQAALDHDYRFLSYGDSSLLWKHLEKKDEHRDNPL